MALGNSQETHAMSETSIPKAPRSRVNWTAPERAEWLALFEKSGQTAAEFCRDNDLSPATLSFWLRQQGAPEPEQEPALVEVMMPTPSTAPASAAVTVRLPSGLRMEITAGTDPKWLAQLLRVLVPAKG
jgi:transposase-like protein